MVTTAQKGALGVVKPSLSLDFRSGVLDSRITFTRASTATDFNSAGTIVSFTSGTPRFGYNPVTLAPLGLLIEEGRTNLFLNSLLNGTNLSTQTVTVAAAQYALSFYGTGTITLTGGFTGSLVGTGAFPIRSVLVFTSLAVPLVCTVTGTVQYAQLEATSNTYQGPTSLIPTAGTTVARAAESASMTGANFSSWYNQPAGTFVTRAIPTGSFNELGAILFPCTTAGNNFFLIQKGDGTRVGAGTLWTAALATASLQANINTSAGTAQAASGLALAAQANDVAFVFNGTVVGAATTVVMPAPDRLFIGSLTGPAQWFNGHIAYINYYPRRIQNGQMQSLTS